MLLMQLTGLSGAGKTTLANLTADNLQMAGYKVLVIDGDAYRKTICSDLGFSRNDRMENIRRLAKIGFQQLHENDVVILSAINPYEICRQEIRDQSAFVKTIWIDCPINILEKRDTKGLYKRALLPNNHPDKISNLTGVNDPFETPVYYDLKISTDQQSIQQSVNKMLGFVYSSVSVLRNS